MNKEYAGFLNLLLGVLVLLGVVYFFPWRDITWGRVLLGSEGAVTVSGYAESNETNQMAIFSAGVNAVNDDKDVAVNEVNTKMAGLISAVKEFGIEEEDIKTQSVSVYQLQENEPNRPGRVTPGQWSASNNIEIVLRDPDQASGLTDILNQSGATNVFGPSFQQDTSKRASDALLEAAIADARAKAERMAQSGGAKIGRIVSITEGGETSPAVPFMRAALAEDAVSAPIQVGSTKISKTVTVVWSLR